MRQGIRRMVVTALGVVLAAAVMAAPASAQPIGKATGGGTVGGVSPFKLSFNAQGLDPLDTSAAKGSVELSSDGSHLKGNVTCFVQIGNEAYFAGEIEKGTGGFDPAQGLTGRAVYAISVQDNGESGDPDLVSFIAQVDVPFECFGAGPPANPLENGNIQVSG